MKQLMIKLAMIVAIITVPTTAQAEHSVGFAAGSTRGLGATYRMLPDHGAESSWGWQVTGLPLISQGNGVVSAGAAALYLLHRGEVAMAYASLGAGALVSWDSCRGNADEFCKDESHWGVGVGPGVGFELRVVDNLGWSIEIPLALMFADGDFHGLYPVPNSSLVYYW